MKRKMCLLLSLIFLLPVFAACGASNSQDPTEPVGSSSGSETSTEEPTEKATRKPKETKPADFDDQGNITLDGWSDYVIVRGHECSESEKTASAELRNYIKKISGATLNIVTDEREPSEKEIVVGKTNRENEGEFDYDELGDEGFVIKTRDKKIFIVGGKQRGTLYGVYAYLEEYLGCRFYTSNFEKVPDIDPLPFIEIEENKQIPVFETRNPGWSDMNNHAISAKLKVNGSHGRGAMPEMFGGNLTWAGSCVHTLPKLAELKGDEWENEPCLSDENVYNTVLKNVRALLSANPNAKYISVSQADSSTKDVACKCEKCTELFEATGSRAGVYLTFVNRIANAIKDEYPNVMVHTLAYKYTKDIPTNVVPADNVMVQLCTIEACFRHPLAECTNAIDKATDFEALLKDWSGICKYLAIWDYTTNFTYYNLSFPNFEAMYDNVQLFADNNVKYLYEQGQWQGTNGEFSELRAYLLARLLWDPYMSREQYYAYMDEFLLDYYGEGGAKIREYIDLMHKQTENICTTIYNSPTNYYPCSIKTVRAEGTLPSGITADNLRNYKKFDWTPYYDWYNEFVPNALLTEGQKLFDEAYALATDNLSKSHILKSSIQLDILKIYFENERIAVAEANIYDMVYGLAEKLMGADEATSDFVANAVRSYAVQNIKNNIADMNRAYYNKLMDFGIMYDREGRKLSPDGKYDFGKLPRDWVPAT
ncbi:MAG: DUF4838 domain-containing protein [Ruminococcaceae bacterium]|nr:DUF4838 domain-containing protein [Oscillospiraceae bacterium]